MGNIYPSNIETQKVSAEYRTGAIGALYGIGVSHSILKLKVEGISKNNSNEYPEFIESTPYLPDAHPNANGGYDMTSQWDGKMASSLIGMPVMCHLEFIGGSYLDLQGINRTFPTIDLETVLMTATMSRNIKKTSIQGNYNGDVKEYIGNGDWKIEIRAIISSDAPVNTNVDSRNSDGVYPRANMDEIWTMLQAPVALPINCWFLNQFGINHLVIDDGVRIEQVEGAYNNQVLIIPCVSDNPLIITIAQ